MTPTRRRFAEVVRSEPVDLGMACLLVGGECEPDLDVDVSLAVLDALAASARLRVPVGSSAAVAAEGLRVVLGEQAGFAGFAEDYEDVRSSLLHEVLRRGRGLPLLLSVVWMEVAARLDVPAYAVALPGHVVVGLGDPEDEHVLVDPFAGGRVLTPVAVAQRLAAGGWDPSDVRVLRPADVLLRLLTNVRALTSRQAPALEVTATRLWAVELSLLLPRHPVELRRERGELLVRLGDHLAGAEELETYAMVVDGADETAATAARREARLARAQLN
ncbi:MAG: putative transcriptional regulator [Frankiales bacterium]|nr:putative transcriptional regulator [Frankiales bacterium]